MEAAYFERIAAVLRRRRRRSARRTTIAAFGGAGPMSACGAARTRRRAPRAECPKMAAVFSAFGIGFSDIAQSYEAPVAGVDAPNLRRNQATTAAGPGRTGHVPGGPRTRRLPARMEPGRRRRRTAADFRVRLPDVGDRSRHRDRATRIADAEVRYALPHASIRRGRSGGDDARRSPPPDPERSGRRWTRWTRCRCTTLVDQRPGLRARARRSSKAPSSRPAFPQAGRST